MAWSEIKKAVNSDISTPLNVQILNALNSGKIIKHIQRGIWSGPALDAVGFQDAVITLTGFTNADKMVAFIEIAEVTGYAEWYYTDGGYSSKVNKNTYTGYIKNLTKDSLTIGNASHVAYKYSYTKTRGAGSYLVIEFY